MAHRLRRGPLHTARRRRPGSYRLVVGGAGRLQRQMAHQQLAGRQGQLGRPVQTDRHTASDGPPAAGRQTGTAWTSCTDRHTHSVRWPTSSCPADRDSLDVLYRQTDTQRQMAHQQLAGRQGQLGRPVQTDRHTASDDPPAAGRQTGTAWTSCNVNTKQLSSQTNKQTQKRQRHLSIPVPVPTSVPAPILVPILASVPVPLHTQFHSHPVPPSPNPCPCPSPSPSPVCSSPVVAERQWGHVDRQAEAGPHLGRARPSRARQRVVVPVVRVQLGGGGGGHVGGTTSSELRLFRVADVSSRFCQTRIKKDILSL